MINAVRKSQEPVWLWSEYTGVGLPQWPVCSQGPVASKELREGKKRGRKGGRGHGRENRRRIRDEIRKEGGMSKYQRAGRSFFRVPNPSQRRSKRSQRKAGMRTHKRAHPPSTTQADTHREIYPHMSPSAQAHRHVHTDVYRTEGSDTDEQYQTIPDTCTDTSRYLYLGCRHCSIGGKTVETAPTDTGRNLDRGPQTSQRPSH